MEDRKAFDPCLSAAASFSLGPYESGFLRYEMNNFKEDTMKILFHFAEPLGLVERILYYISI